MLGGILTDLLVTVTLLFLTQTGTQCRAENDFSLVTLPDWRTNSEYVTQCFYNRHNYPICDWTRNQLTSAADDVVNILESGQLGLEGEACLEFWYLAPVLAKGSELRALLKSSTGPVEIWTSPALPRDSWRQVFVPLNIVEPGTQVVLEAVSMEGQVTFNRIGVRRGSCGQQCESNTELWTDESTHCLCSVGQLSCFPTQCPKGQICGPQRGGSSGISASGTCTIHSNTDFSTFDGVLFRFMGPCTYTLAQTCSLSETLPVFSVEVVNEQNRNSSLPTVQWVIVEMGKYRVSLLNRQTHRVVVNGVWRYLPLKLDSGTVNINSNPVAVTLETSFGLSVSYDNTGTVHVNLPPTYSDHVCGLCGNFNHLRGDDFRKPDGINAQDATALAESWQTGQSNSSCETIIIPYQCDPLLEVEYASELYCGVLLSSAGPFADCLSVLRADSYFRGCVNSMCSTHGDPRTLCESLQVYTDVCQEAGVPIPKWRDSTFCPLECGENSHFNSCADGCPEVCSSLDISGSCGSCEERCECDSGFKLSRGKCVPAEACGCWYNGKHYERGEILMEGECVQQCQCMGNNDMQCIPMQCTDKEVCKVKDGFRGCFPFEPATCTVYGDGHYITYDGMAYSFQGGCSYTLTTTCGGESSIHFTVIGHNMHLPLQNFTQSKLEVVALTVEDLYITLNQNGDVFVNNVHVRLPYSTNGPYGSVWVYMKNNYIILETTFGLRMMIDGQDRLFLQVDERYKYELCGLCGTYSEQQDDDFVTPGGQIAAGPYEFGDSWLVPANNDCISHPNDPRQCDYHEENDAYNACFKLHWDAFMPCHDFIHPSIYFNSCVYDYCATSGDQQSICESLKSYAAACQVAGVELPHWQTDAACDGNTTAPPRVPVPTTAAPDPPVVNVTVQLSVTDQPPVANVTIPPAVEATTNLMNDTEAPDSRPTPLAACQLHCDFEQDLCQWRQLLTDVFHWTWHRGSTSATMTGPSSDHTTGDGHYLYIKANSVAHGDTARLISSECSNDGPQCLQFWYRMYGSADTMGLYVYLLQDRKADIVWWKRTDQGNMWHLAQVDLSTTGAFQILFEGRRGSNDQSDVAIDDVSLQLGHCTVMAKPTSPAPTILNPFVTEGPELPPANSSPAPQPQTSSSTFTTTTVRTTRHTGAETSEQPKPEITERPQTTARPEETTASTNEQQSPTTAQPLPPTTTNFTTTSRVTHATDFETQTTTMPTTVTSKTSNSDVPTRPLLPTTATTGFQTTDRVHPPTTEQVGVESSVQPEPEITDKPQTTAGPEEMAASTTDSQPTTGRPQLLTTANAKAPTTAQSKLLTSTTFTTTTAATTVDTQITTTSTTLIPKTSNPDVQARPQLPITSRAITTPPGPQTTTRAEQPAPTTAQPQQPRTAQPQQQTTAQPPITTRPQPPTETQSQPPTTVKVHPSTISQTEPQTTDRLHPPATAGPKSPTTANAKPPYTAPPRPQTTAGPQPPTTVRPLSTTAPPQPTTSQGPKPTATARPKLTTGPQPTATAGPKLTVTAAPKPTATSAPKPTVTSGPKPTVTAGPKTTATAGPQPIATAGPKPTATAGPKPTTTAGPQPTKTAGSQTTTTARLQQTATAEPKPTATAGTKSTATVGPQPTATAGPKPTTPAGPQPTVTAGLKPSTTAGPQPTITAGPKPSTTAGPQPSTAAEPQPTTTTGPQPSTTAGPRPIITTGPQTTTRAGPQPATTAGPKSTAAAGPQPSITAGPKPSTTTGPQPTITAGPKSSTTTGPKPSTNAGPKPSTTAGPKPSTAAGPQPTTTAGPQPTITAGPQPTTTAGPKTVTTAGPKPITTAGLQSSTTAGPKPTTAAGLQPSTTTGPQPIITTGPQTTTRAGPQPATTAGPKSTAAAGPQPTITAGPQPSTTTGPKPATTARPQPSTATGPRPTTTAGPQPSTTTRPKPSTTAGPKPSTTAGPKPSTAAGPQPTTTAGPQPKITAGPQPTTTAGPKTVTTAGPKPITTAGLQSSTTAGPKPTTAAGLQPSTTTGPQPIITTGPQTTTRAGPQPATTAGPKSTAAAGPQPTITAGPQPSTTTGPKPATTAGPQPSTATGPRPTTTAGPQPSTTAGPQPTTTTGPKPVTTTGRKPLTAAGPKPITTAGLQPSTTAGPKPTTAARLQPLTTTGPQPIITAGPQTTTRAGPQPTTTAGPKSTAAAGPKLSTAAESQPTTIIKTRPTISTPKAQTTVQPQPATTGRPQLPTETLPQTQTTVKPQAPTVSHLVSQKTAKPQPTTTGPPQPSTTARPEPTTTIRTHLTTGRLQATTTAALQSITMTGLQQSTTPVPTPSCPRNSHYTTCIPACKPTCTNLNGPERCSVNEGCVQGCVCDDGFVQNRWACVPIQNCGCVDRNGTKYQFNKVWYTSHCRQKCECEREHGVGKIDCNDKDECDGNAVCLQNEEGDYNCQSTGFNKCTINEDSEYKTFDKRKYDFEGEHSYVLVQTKNLPNNFPDVYIEGINRRTIHDDDDDDDDDDEEEEDEDDEEDDDSEESDERHRLQELKIRVYNHTMEFKRHRRLVLDGRTTNTPVIPTAGLKVYEHSSHIYLKTDFGLSVEFDGQNTAEIILPRIYRRKVEGLCGNFDAKKWNDLMKPDGTWAKNVEEFEESWRV